jgi:drug/metabolite transporter (DMT)-like permease
MSTSVIGLLCLMFFAISQGVRDALFGNVFQSFSIFLVATLAFGASTLVFVAIAAIRRPGDFKTLGARPLAFLALNITTAIAWLCFFFGLKHLEPAVVATLYNGIGPIAVLVMEARGWTANRVRPHPVEWLFYLGIAAALASLVYVAVSDRSGLAASDLFVQAMALVAVLTGGVMITLGHMIARWFNDQGAGSDAVLGTRFLLTLVAAIGFEMAVGPKISSGGSMSLPVLTLTAFALIIVPAYVIQLGIARTSALAVNVIRALGPVSVFAFQQIDGRLHFSGPTLICVTAFCVSAIGASVFRGWSEVRAPSKIAPESAD